MLKRSGKNPKDFYTRRNVGLNLSSKPVNWATFGVTAQYANRGSLEPLYAQWRTTANSNGYGLLMRQLLNTWPTIPYELDDKRPSRNDNGIFLTQLSDQTNNRNNLVTTLSVAVEPIKNWTTRIMHRFRTRNSEEERYIKRAYWYNFREKRRVLRNANTAGDYYKRRDVSFYNSPQLLSSYELTHGNHYGKVFVGAEQEYNYFERLTARKQGGVSDEVASLNTGTGEDEVDEGKTHWATQSLFGGLNYTFGKRYVLNASVRRDGSSRFVKEKRWGTFFSYALAYNVSNEPALKPFFKKAKIDALKLKFSAGQIGNQNVGLYDYQETLSIRTNNGWLQDDNRDLYTRAPGLVNVDRTWETLTDRNFGIEFTALNKRLSGNFVYYNRETVDMLGPVAPLPSTLGTGVPRANNTEMITRGFTSVISWKDKIGDFSYGLQFMLSDYQSEITKYRNPEGLLNSWYVGRKFGEIWGYETVDFMDADTAARVHANSQNADTEGTAAYPNQREFRSQWTEGDTRYKDLNGDGKITDGNNTLKNPGDRKIIGNSTPRYRYSLDTNFKWKGFGLRLFFQGIGKRDINLSGRHTGPTNMFGEMLKDHLDYWRPDNKDAFFPKPYFNTGKNRVTQTRYIISAAYLRLKNISLSYEIPKRVLKRIGVKRAFLTFSADNIFTITAKRLPGYVDPELSVGGSESGGVTGSSHPLYRTYAVGVNLTI